MQSNQTAELSEFLELVILRASDFRQMNVDKTMQSLRRFLLKNLSNIYIKRKSFSFLRAFEIQVE
ncbi:hypothetical protein [Leptospira kirschneri]|uniref:Uncharacterized protein n=1 Tax=Leptospira kirschneri str. 200802841 TaxID=1193047 RepID=A0A828XRT2_9LEPT|nr:hypothetical protein [Leptospira kirschneri]EMO74936.1 hypothetical protein LEP1GSC127_0401 [Leptospira kirschneri str. 200801925]EJO67949.1 hypothetical protein LEP1GSC044_0411 [Leptospira kirschneri serovar Grippotyphosa str. RM52]EKO49746.1 hypothetical protein LEP1GSC131_0070 [Leptospira kirschneri str. 200802841]EKP06945.1 hypothetical protein LEP1GSC018_1253 [Leptospira kirschneri str. 2008720114]EKQ85561.1 hypothetical protein LEP1GSC064_0537 [Leptospira kirschneri serovar Grippotyph